MNIAIVVLDDQNKTCDCVDVLKQLGYEIKKTSTGDEMWCKLCDDREVVKIHDELKQLGLRGFPYVLVDNILLTTLEAKRKGLISAEERLNILNIYFSPFYNVKQINPEDIANAFKEVIKKRLDNVMQLLINLCKKQFITDYQYYIQDAGGLDEFKTSVLGKATDAINIARGAVIKILNRNNIVAISILLGKDYNQYVRYIYQETDKFALRYVERLGIYVPPKLKKRHKIFNNDLTK